jgi:hypothetical protein
MTPIPTTERVLTFIAGALFMLLLYGACVELKW